MFTMHFKLLFSSYFNIRERKSRNANRKSFVFFVCLLAKELKFIINLFVAWNFENNWKIEECVWNCIDQSETLKEIKRFPY